MHLNELYSMKYFYYITILSCSSGLESALGYEIQKKGLGQKKFSYDIHYQKTCIQAIVLSCI